MNMNSKPARPVASTLLVLALMLGMAQTGMAQTYEDLERPPEGEWPQFQRDVTRSGYSPLDQIDTTNVADLRMVWARDLGFGEFGRPTDLQGQPVVWDGVMYVSTDTGILALDATNGFEIWNYSNPTKGEPTTDDFPRAALRNVPLRGAPVIYDGKVFFNLRRGMTIALDAATGEEVWAVQLTEIDRNEGFTTNPIIANGNLVVGPSGADYAGAPGRIVSLNAEDGEILWTFHTVPLSPDHPAADTWTNLPSWEAGIGGASAWNAGAYDPVTRTVVWGTGQPMPWDRLDRRRANEGEPSADLYSASFVGLDVDTGELKWYHQVVPADEWDYDQHTVPVLTDLEIDGDIRRVALLATTTGFLVVVDAETGEFIAGHQIHPDPTVHVGYEQDGTPIIDQAMRHEGEEDFHRICPGRRWAGIAPAAFNPETGLYYRPNQLDCLNYAASAIPDDWQPGQTAFDQQVGPRDDTYWFDGRRGGVSAIDPATGEVVWEWGTYYSHDAGAITSGGGLVFFSAPDARFRALDAATGEILFEHRLTTGSEAGTITYGVGGRQYVATMAGLGSSARASHPDADVPTIAADNAAIFVFALPE